MCINLNKIIEILISYFSPKQFLMLIDLTIQIRTEKLKIIGLMD